jgi:cell division ATPase FtsA
VAREFKRRIGDQTPILLGDGGHTAHELTARLARWVVDLVRRREGGEPEQISITHPAGWGGHKTSLLGTALAEVGLGDTLLLSEPAAAAIAYAASERVCPGDTIAVYDLGGGTVDTAVLRRDSIGSFELVGEPAGDDHFGGVDFDELLFERIRDQFPDLLAGLSPDDPLAVSAVGRLRREITEAKEALSADTETVIPVLLPSGQRQARVIRAEFEAMIRAALEETVDLMRRTIHSAGLTEADLTAVLLVGGSSRIPLVTELLSAGLGRPVAVDADPKATVAVGAVLSASLDTVVEPVPAIVAMAAPPARPSEPEIPLHLVTPARPPRVFRPRLLAGAAGLALATMATGALVYSAQTSDIGTAPAQAATPGGTTPTETQPPAPGTHAAAHKSPKTSGRTTTTTTPSTSGSTTTSAPAGSPPAPATTTSGPDGRVAGPLAAPPPAPDPEPSATSTQSPSPTTPPPTTDSSPAGQPHNAPPPADPPPAGTTSMISSAPAPTTTVESTTATTAPGPTTT